MGKLLPEKLPLFVALSQMHFLTFHEKDVLSEKIESLQELCGFSFGQFEMAVGRPVKKGRSKVDYKADWNTARIAKDVESILYLLRAFQIKCIPASLYPSALKNIYDPPFMLYVRGDETFLTADSDETKSTTPPQAAGYVVSPEELHSGAHTLIPPQGAGYAPLRHESSGHCVAVVGTRHPSMNALKAARSFSHDAANDGITVVSGLAYGIDAAAHSGAYEAENGATIAVLATGCDTVSPAANRALARAVVERKRGCLVSEYPPGTAAAKWRFVQRNRIIAGLSAATLVVEAPEGSGALLTADYALDMDRELFIHACAKERSMQLNESEASRTILSYIRDGAKVIDSYQAYKDFLTWQN
ncbi:MAG: hypothetical protein Ta2A_07440 [Treponemataceae bacterium]|nr:MAG: hypothetical protein Ta2A_07440 [Treponemataceae bacterium]